MKEDAKNNVRDWTEEDEKKYREMLATPAKRLTEEEMLKLAAVSPHPPLGAGTAERKPKENEKQQETPFFSDNNNFAKEITEAGIKAAKATHEFNMKEIKAKMLADICTALIKTHPDAVRYLWVAEAANEIVEQTLEKM